MSEEEFLFYASEILKKEIPVRLKRICYRKLKKAISKLKVLIKELIEIYSWFFLMALCIVMASIEWLYVHDAISCLFMIISIFCLFLGQRKIVKTAKGKKEKGK